MDSNMDSNVINLLKQAFTLLNVSPNCHTINCCKCLTTPPQTEQTIKNCSSTPTNKTNEFDYIHMLANLLTLCSVYVTTPLF